MIQCPRCVRSYAVVPCHAAIQIVLCHAAIQTAWQMPVEVPEYWLSLLAQPEAVVGGISDVNYLWNVVHSNSNCHDWSYACKGRESHLHSINIFGQCTLCSS